MPPLATRYKNMRTNQKNHEILQLPPRWQKRLFWTRAVFSIAVSLAGLGLVSAILFPTLGASFDFKNPNSSRNTLIAPRHADGSENKNGKLSALAALSFGAAAQEPFSRAIAEINLERNAPTLEGARLKVRKTYQALLYEEKNPALLRPGTVARYEGIYYFAAPEGLRPFSSLETAVAYGYSAESFLALEEKEFLLHPQSTEIRDARFPLEGQLFKIGEDYYRYGAGKLTRFVSDKAFLSLYEPRFAAAADDSFLEKHPPSEELLGFADGTLLSDSEAVYVISGPQRLPIDNVLTFQALGYLWDDVLPASGEEAGIYEKGKLFTAKNPHPDGSVLCAEEGRRCWVVEKRTLRPLQGSNIRAQYLKRNPVSVDLKSLAESADCLLSSSRFSFRKFSCTLSTANIEYFPGNVYAFDLNPPKDTEIENIHVSLTRPKNMETALTSLSLLKRRALGNYAPAQ